MVIDKKIDELRQDYRFYIKCKRVVWEKPKLVAQINSLIKETEKSIEFREVLNSIPKYNG